jgi:hypothetical protein
MVSNFYSASWVSFQCTRFFIWRCNIIIIFLLPQCNKGSMAKHRCKYYYY